MISRPPFSSRQWFLGELAVLTIIWITFLGIYWGMVFLGVSVSNTNLNAFWSDLGPGVLRVRIIYYWGPIFFGIAAAYISGVFRVARKGWTFPWFRILAFSALFYVFDGSAFAISLYPSDVSAERIRKWLDSSVFPLAVHEALAPFLAVIGATVAARSVTFREGDKSSKDYYNRGVDYLNARDYQRAIAEFTESIQLDRVHAVAYANRGKAYSLLEDHGQAIADYTEAIRLGPPDVGIVYRLRSKEYLAIGNQEAASSDVRMAAKGV